MDFGASGFVDSDFGPSVFNVSADFAAPPESVANTGCSTLALFCARGERNAQTTQAAAISRMAAINARRWDRGLLSASAASDIIRDPNAKAAGRPS
jgi:hypothetical protein